MFATSFVEFALQDRLIRRLVLLERLFHLGQQVLVQKADDFIPLLVHNAVDAEIKIGLIQLEQFLKQATKFFKVGRHVNPSSFSYLARPLATES